MSAPVVVVCVSLPKLPVLRCAAIQLAPTGAGFQGWVRGSGVAQPPSASQWTAQTAAFVDVLLVMSISGRGSIPQSLAPQAMRQRATPVQPTCTGTRNRW